MERYNFWKSMNPEASTTEITNELRNIQTMLFIISCQSIQSISLQVIPVFAGASQLSAEQEHQREKVNHLALTSGGDLFPRLHLFQPHPQLLVRRIPLNRPAQWADAVQRRRSSRQARHPAKRTAFTLQRR